MITISFCFQGFKRFCSKDLDVHQKYKEVIKDFEREKNQKGKEVRNKVFYVSLVATEVGGPKVGQPAKEHYLFDLFTEFEFENLDVVFMGTKELQQFYLDNGGTKKSSKNEVYDVVTYDYLAYFISKNRGSSFIVDEVPFCRHGSKF